jgi:hypothetical protein
MSSGKCVYPAIKVQSTMSEKKIIKLRKVETTNRDETNFVEEHCFLNANASYT